MENGWWRSFVDDVFPWSPVNLLREIGVQEWNFREQLTGLNSRNEYLWDKT